MNALNHFSAIQKKLKGKKIALFLDFDGTLSFIVSDPDKALLSKTMRKLLRSLCDHFIVGVLSGRALKDVKKKVGIKGIYYAGSHGFEIEDPDGRKIEIPEINGPMIQKELEKLIKPYAGAHIEVKPFAIAVHYRQADQKQEIIKKVKALAKLYPDLKLQPGKEVLNFTPNINWDKGQALLEILAEIDAFPIYIGDDVTDEDVFKVLKKKGIGILVADKKRKTAASYTLKSPEEVELFLKMCLFYCL